VKGGTFSLFHIHCKRQRSVEKLANVASMLRYLIDITSQARLTVWLGTMDDDAAQQTSGIPVPWTEESHGGSIWLVLIRDMGYCWDDFFLSR
jgi:hypothetical protein